MRPLRILMVAPQPFFTPRGTPFSVLHRIRALGRMGHQVDLFTYPFGTDPGIEGLRIYRSARPPLVREVQIGPSIAKLVLDAALFVGAARAARSVEYDLIHTHEEAGILGGFLQAWLGIPHIYDMHSSLPQQFGNFGRFDWAPVVRAFEGVERYTLTRSTGVIVVYPELLDRVRDTAPGLPVALLENTLDLDRPETLPAERSALRKRLGLEGRVVVTYTGTLEEYQGLDLLLTAARLLRNRLPNMAVLIVGGTHRQTGRLEEAAARLGVSDVVTFLPAVPPEDVFLLHDMSDALVTCRIRGTNTPLKIYQYLRSGRPIIATDIPSHTQVLDKNVAELARPTPEGIADAIERVMKDPDHGRALASAARALARAQHGEDRYMRTLEAFLAEVTHGVREGVNAPGPTSSAASPTES